LENLLANQEKRLLRAIEQLGQQQVRAGFETYLAELSTYKSNSTCRAYLQDHGIVYKWKQEILAKQLLLLHPRLSRPRTDEEMLVALKLFLKIH